MQGVFVGRQEEQQILTDALHANEADFIAVFGRRRVGKTFLIKHTYREHFSFEITGLPNVSKQEQLQHFSFTLNQYLAADAAISTPKTWLEAFQQLVRYLGQQDKQSRQVIFFDELPWLAGSRSDFLSGLSYFWNSWAVNENVVVVICGSAASWMIQKVIHNTGGLYNRVTKRIFLQPFSLTETELFLRNRHIHYSRQQIAELYMALGGIPHYLKEVKAGKSAVQNIDDICFSRQGLLNSEFVQLYPSLFNNAKRHLAIIKTLAKHHQGLTRTALRQQSKLTEGGNLTKTLEELEQSGFISTYIPFGKKKKGKLYRLTDEYSLFYLKFIEDNASQGAGTWQHLSQSQAYKSWSGYAFENLALKHLSAIKAALGIAGIYAQSSSFYQPKTPTQDGTQIDLLIDRSDRVINLFEIKYYNSEVSLTKKQAENLRQKASVLREVTQTKKHLSICLLSIFGLKHNQYSLGLIDNILTLDDLF